MRTNWKLAFVLGLCLFVASHVRADFDEDEDDDGVIEEEPELPAAPPVPVEKVKYEAPRLTKKPHFAEPFDNKATFNKKWTKSQAKKDDTDEVISKYDGVWSVEAMKEESMEGDMGLTLKSKAKHHAIASKLDKTFDFKGKPFIVSYEVNFQNGLDCGGAYIKLLSKEAKMDLKTFNDKSPYTVMFGPDKCGLDFKLHFIFRHKNPKTGEYEEKHAKKPSGKLEKFFTDKKTHLYTLVVNPDNTFEILVDNKEVNSGSLLEDVSPPVNPPKEIDDPNDKKPENWDEKEKIADPDATKPDDWDEDQPMEMPDESAVKPEGWLDDEKALIPDPDAEKPEDWDSEMDGEWEAPLIDNENCKSAPGCGEWSRPSIPNPLYKGKWRAPQIDNPGYQGVWKPQRIENPEWFEDLEPYKMTPVEAVGLELWSMTDDIAFDNFLITDDRQQFASWIEQTWERKIAAEYAAASGHNALVQGILDATQERPWLWAVFLVVIVLPVVLVIAYCCVPKHTEQGIWNTLMSSAEQRPWLWAVYVVVFLLPIMLLSFCLCPRSGPIKQEDIDAARKKTDEVSPDDDNTTQDKQDVGPDGDAKQKTKKSKAALEKEEEEEKTEDEKTEEEVEEEVEEEEETSDSVRRSPRKRKTRKD